MSRARRRQCCASDSLYLEFETITTRLPPHSHQKKENTFAGRQTKMTNDISCINDLDFEADSVVAFTKMIDGQL